MGYYSQAAANIGGQIQKAGMILGAKYLATAGANKALKAQQAESQGIAAIASQEVQTKLEGAMSPEETKTLLGMGYQQYSESVAQYANKNAYKQLEASGRLKQQYYSRLSQMSDEDLLKHYEDIVGIGGTK